MSQGAKTSSFFGFFGLKWVIVIILILIIIGIFFWWWWGGFGFEPFGFGF